MRKKQKLPDSLGVIFLGRSGHDQFGTICETCHASDIEITFGHDFRMVFVNIARPGEGQGNVKQKQLKLICLFICPISVDN